MFGFTGTPVFATKVCAASGAKPFTTAQTFGYQLHTYTIVGAIDEKNVLPLLNARALHTESLKQAGAIKGKDFLFFSEIQEVTGWEKCVNSFRVSADCGIYITGSNAKLLPGELATYLDGRYV